MIQNNTLLSKYNGATTHTQASFLNKGYRRRNARVMLSIMLVLVFLMFGAFGSNFFGDQDAYAASETESLQKTVIVEQGDTLWSIASEHAAKGQDIRELVHDLKRTNGLKNSTLKIGQKLVLP